MIDWDALLVVLALFIMTGLGLVLGEAYGRKHCPKATWQDTAITRMWRYLQHKDGCAAGQPDSMGYPLDECTCGLDKLVVLIKAAPTQKGG